ncbi:hypothetical protein QUF61_18070, partial [Candidatus Venteria ishoeyi]|uniref:hypothetical protein n=1 Tax=Candidatus Venteria ishoeyi TaxID=1899563 RepID=UPI0025A610B2
MIFIRPLSLSYLFVISLLFNNCMADAIFDPDTGILHFDGMTLDNTTHFNDIDLQLISGSGMLQAGSLLSIQGATQGDNGITDGDFSSIEMLGDLPITLIQPQGKNFKFHMKFKEINGNIQITQMTPHSAAIYNAQNGELHLPMVEVTPEQRRILNGSNVTLQRVDSPTGKLVENADFIVISHSEITGNAFQAYYNHNGHTGVIPEILVIENNRLLSYRAQIKGDNIGGEGHYKITGLALNGADGAPGKPGAAGAAGTPGLEGAPGLDGLPGLSWKGTWDTAVVYNSRDAVNYNGSSYISIQDTNQNNEPPAAGFWDTLAVKGTAGAAGIAGAAGA